MLDLSLRILSYVSLVVFTTGAGNNNVSENGYLHLEKKSYLQQIIHEYIYVFL